MTPQELQMLKVRSQITALELVMATVLAAITKTATARASLLSTLDQMVGRTEQVRFPGMPPEYSDLVSAEIQEATSTLVSFLRDHLSRR